MNPNKVMRRRNKYKYKVALAFIIGFILGYALMYAGI